jgi:C-terminal processing protease CtpA/Prc
MKKSILFLALSVITLNSVNAQNTLSPSDKVYGLSKFWQEVNYNFVYFDKVDRTMWDNSYRKLISIVQNTKNDYEYYRELQKFCALLKDGHTNVFFPESIKQMNTKFGDYRLFIENIDGKAIIVRTNLSKKNEIPLGSEVIEVNGKTTEKFIEENVAPYISSSTDYVLKDRSIGQLLSGLEGENFYVKIRKPNNQIIELKLTHQKTEEEEVYPAFEADMELLNFKWINSKIAYISLNSFEDKKIDSLFLQKLPELYKAKALIIDLRYNGGGNSAIAGNIAKYFTKEDKIIGAKSSTRLHRSAFKAWGANITDKDTINDTEAKECFLNFNNLSYQNLRVETYNANDIKKLIVPITIFTSHNTASSAEDFLLFLDNQKHIIKIGENTFGSTGQPFTFELPGGAFARVCAKKDTYQDGREFVGYGIKPDIIIKTTLNDFLAKKDPVLDKSIQYLKEKVK